jgi:N-acetylmuramoyl-L-alanine amidase
MKIAIDLGHNVENDTGAVGIRAEDELIMEVGKLVLEKLIFKAIDTILCTPKKARDVNHSLNQRIAIANMSKADLFVSIHFNKFGKGANGSEVYYISVKGKEYAVSVQDELVKLGFRDRGVKVGNFAVLKRTLMPAILVECCFCDSEKDMELYDAEKVASAIVNGILLVK